MQPRLVHANENVEADRGMVAIERGPLVYCAEWADNECNLRGLLLGQAPTFELAQRPIDDFIPEASKEKLSTYKTQTITTLSTDAQALSLDEAGQLTTQEVKLTLIPYYAWAHRGSGNMRVWLPQEMQAATPTSSTIATKSTIESSMRIPALSSINDQLIPRDANDRTIPYTHWWPKNGSTEWITYTFAEKATVQSCTLYWFDDQPWGGCTVPQSWRILYLDTDGNWEPVKNPDAYPTTKGQPCTVHFKPVATKALKLEVTMNSNLSAGLFEWIVK